MNSKLFQILNALPAVQSVLGNPLRLYPFGRAPQGVQKPYAVYTVFNAAPENYVSDVPDIARKGVQVDIVAEKAAQVSAIFTAIKDGIQTHGHITSYATTTRDADTDFYGARLEIDLWEA